MAHRAVATRRLDSAELLAYECWRVPMEAAKIYFIVFGALTIVGGIIVVIVAWVKK